jgi:hypothetical protein
MSHGKEVKEIGTNETHSKRKNKEIRNNNSVNEDGEFQKEGNI